jgi:hypothetical protein
VEGLADKTCFKAELNTSFLSGDDDEPAMITSLALAIMMMKN